jgi:hypothetical protein
MKIFTQEMKQPVLSTQDVQRPRQRRNRVLVIGVASILLFAIIIGAFIYAMIAWTTSITSPVSAAVDHYYAAIQNQQYTKAYSYLDSRLTYNGVLITADGYTQAANGQDATAGKVTTYSISNVGTSWNFGQNIARATVHVTRAHRSYDVHLALKLEGNTYKITDFDDI